MAEQGLKLKSSDSQPSAPYISPIVQDCSLRLCKGFMIFLLPHLRNEKDDLYLTKLLLTLKVNVQSWEVALPWQKFPALIIEAIAGSSLDWAFTALCVTLH